MVSAGIATGGEERRDVQAGGGREGKGSRSGAARTRESCEDQTQRRRVTVGCRARDRERRSERYPRRVSYGQLESAIAEERVRRESSGVP